MINLQVIKERDESDQGTGTRKEVVFGEEEEILELFELGALRRSHRAGRADPSDNAADERSADQDLSVQRASASRRCFRCIGQPLAGKTQFTTCRGHTRAFGLT